MNFHLEQISSVVHFNLNDLVICAFNDSELLDPLNFKSQNIHINLDLSTKNVNFTLTSSTFEIITVSFDKLEKVSPKEYRATPSGHPEITIFVENATIVSEKKLIIGFTGTTNLIFQFQNYSTQIFTSSANFKAMEVPQSVTIFNSTPTFSITFFDSQNTQLFDSYKDKQILNGNLNKYTYVQVISNLQVNAIQGAYPKLTLLQYFHSGLSTSYVLTSGDAQNSLAAWSGQIPISDSTSSANNDGNAKFFVSLKPFFYQSSFETISGVTSGVNYSAITNMNIGLNSSIYTQSLSYSSAVGILSYSSGISTTGFAAFSTSPQWIYSPAYVGTKIPNLQSYNYLSFAYSTSTASQNGFIGCLCTASPINPLTFSNYPYVQALFVAAEDLLNSTINLSAYNIVFKINYTNGTMKTIYPVSKNIQIFNDGAQNYISATINWYQYFDTNLTLLSIVAQIVKQPLNYPTSFRIYQYAIYGLSQLGDNVVLPMSFKSKAITQSSTNDNPINIKPGDFILGYLDDENIDTKVLAVEEGNVEPMIKISFEDGGEIEVPESFSVYSNSSFVKVFLLEPGFILKSTAEYKKISALEYRKFRPYFVIVTEAGNYYADDILVKPDY